MTWEIFGQILLALAVGGAIGLEREFRTGIGLRTLMLVCLGATLFTVYGEQFPLADGDPRRITSSVVAAVGFLGAGIPPEVPSWGNIMAEGRTYFQLSPWIIFYPGIALALTVLSVNILGDGLRDTLDPRIARKM